jgi:hypothetical protein
MLVQVNYPNCIQFDDHGLCLENGDDDRFDYKLSIGVGNEESNGRDKTDCW